MPVSPLISFDPDAVRIALERELMVRLTRELGDLAPQPRDYEEVRREWFWTSELLPDAQQVRVRRLVAATRAALGISREIELFQKAGVAPYLNAATHGASDGPILIQLQGALLDRLDDEGVIAVLGHEVGHHLAHGSSSVRGIDPFFLYWRLQRGRRAGYRELAAAYCRAAELTADRIGFLACRNVDAIVRMEAALDGNGSVDSVALLQRSREYAEELGRDRRRSLGDSHPEEAVRIYAMWLFSESDVYRELTGLGSGSRSLEEIDWTLARLVGPSESAEDMGLPPEGEPCLLDRARDVIENAGQRVRAGVVGSVRELLSGVAPVERDDSEDLDLAEVDRDPLEEKFAELERGFDDPGDLR